MRASRKWLIEFRIEWTLSRDVDRRHAEAWERAGRVHRYVAGIASLAACHRAAPPRPARQRRTHNTTLLT